MRILAFPKNGVAYNECFYRALESRGVEVLEGIFSGGWLSGTIRPGDWLHIHWPSFSYSERRGRAKLLLRFSRFIALLLLARMKGARVAWTAHNLLPHDPSALSWLDVLGRHFVIRLSSVILVHGPEAASVLVERFPAAREKIVQIPHGHWIDHYPATIGCAEARTKLGIAADAFVYLFAGLCKSYKNLDGLVRAFREQKEDGILLIAGKFQDPAYHAEILRVAGNDPRVRIHAGFIPDDELQTFFAACNVVAVPYREILTSGTAMLAMSFGRPVVSIDRGFLHDVITRETGVLFPPDDPQGLSSALLEARKIHFDEERIRGHARQFSFDEAAESCLAAFEKMSSANKAPTLPSLSAEVSALRGETATGANPEERRPPA